MAAIEVCFKKLTGSAGDYSEQQLVDCGYQQNGANGIRVIKLVLNLLLFHRRTKQSV